MSIQHYLTTHDKTQLYLDIKEKSSPIWIIATHGIGEHSGRHGYLNDLFDHSFNVCRYDLRAHGKSSGERSKVKDFNLFIEDLHQLIHYLKERYKMKRYILFGHSMGALISAAYIQQKVDRDFYPERIFLNAPPVALPGPMGALIKNTSRKIWHGLTRLPVSIPLAGLIDLNDLSHNAEVAARYKADPLNILKLQSCLVLGMVHKSKEVFSRPLRPLCPAFVTVGSADKIVGPKAIHDYFTMVEKAFHLKEIEGARHEIHNEIEKYRRPYFDHMKSVFEEARFPDGA